VGPRAGLDGCGKSRPHRDSIPGPSSAQQVAIPTTISQPTKSYVGLTHNYIVWHNAEFINLTFFIAFLVKQALFF
jgi:hypothetical protein